MPAEQLAEKLLELDAIAHRLRADCPWDREQNERSIVPHTVEEAYELADAAHSGDDAKLLDELGDVLFQVVFLALLLEERGSGSLAAVAEHCSQKLIRRHPHVYGEVEVEHSAEVLKNWDAIKQGERGRDESIFTDVPENLPGLLLARKLQRRAATVGFDWDNLSGPFSKVDEELAELRELVDENGRTPSSHGSEPLYHELGDLLFAVVNLARKLKVDPEIALRQCSTRFQDRVEQAEKFALADGKKWTELAHDQQEHYYQLARANLETDTKLSSDEQDR